MIHREVVIFKVFFGDVLVCTGERYVNTSKEPPPSPLLAGGGMWGNLDHLRLRTYTESCGFV